MKIFNPEKISFLKFDKDFKIIDNNSLIILAANGVGKTSICNQAMKEHEDEYELINYENIKQSFIEDKKGIIIKPNIINLNKEKEKLNQIIELFKEEKTKDNLKKYGINYKSDAEAISSNVVKAKSNELVEIDKKKVNLFKRIDKEDVKFILKNFDDMKSFHLTKEELKEYKNNCLSNLYKDVKNVIKDNTKICPICGSKLERPLMDIIVEKEKKLSQIHENLLIKYSKNINAINLNIADLKEKFNKLLRFSSLSKVNKEAIGDYLIVDGSLELADKINNYKKEFDLISDKINKYETQARIFYDRIRIKSDYIKDLFNKKFKIPFSKVNFNDDEKILKISLEREKQTYSTGELNLMVFIVYLLKFESSDNRVLILDDPLSSYDVVNQYTIMYEIIKVLDNQEKKVIIFTHSIDCLNIAISQYSKIFKYKYLEKNNNLLYLNDIKIPSKTNIVSFDKLVSKDDTTKHLLKSLKNRDNKRCKTYKEDMNIFHYHKDNNSEYTIYLIDLINNFQNFNNLNFNDNNCNKIIYLAASRAWIEKELYKGCTNKEEFLKKKTLGEKINYIFPKNGDSLWEGNKQITREYLMSKKVMLNQNCHYKSQSSPFYYALNLSLDDLKGEILDLKKAFKN